MEDREQGFTVWITGLPGSGKSTLLHNLAHQLRGEGYSKIEIIDEDFYIESSNDKSQMSKRQWSQIVNEMGHLADLLSQKGVVVLVSTLSPFREIRKTIRRNHKAPLVLVYADASLEVLVGRDGKGFYKNLLKRGIKNLTLWLDTFERPHPPDIHVLTDLLSIEDSAEYVLNQLDQLLELNLPPSYSNKNNRVQKSY